MPLTNDDGSRTIFYQGSMSHIMNENEFQMLLKHTQISSHEVKQADEEEKEVTFYPADKCHIEEDNLNIDQNQGEKITGSGKKVLKSTTLDARSQTSTKKRTKKA